MRRAFLIAVMVASALVGCDHSQDVPSGASYKDPTGANAAAKQRMADSAKAFAERMQTQHPSGQ